MGTKITVRRDQVKIIEGSVAEELFKGINFENTRSDLLDRLRKEVHEGATDSSEFSRDDEMMDGVNEDLEDSTHFGSAIDFTLVNGERWRPHPIWAKADCETHIKSILEVSREQFLSTQSKSNILGPLSARAIQDQLEAWDKTTANASRLLANKLRRVLFSRAQSRRLYDQEQGRLSSRALSQFIASPSVFNRLYETKTQGQKIDTHIELLVDLSGSMGGTKIDLAAAASLCLGDTLNGLKSLGVSFGISGFTTHDRIKTSLATEAKAWKPEEPTQFNRAGEGVEHSTWFAQGEDWRRARTRIPYMSNAYRLRNNADGEALAWMNRKLHDVKATRKILIVLSDGCPACGGGQGDLVSKTRAEALCLEREGVEVFGVGIEDNSALAIYSEACVINSAKDLEAVLVERLATYLLKGNN